MAYVNVAEWSPDQVTDWLKGLDSAIWNYIPYFLNNEIVGKTLLQIRPDELQKLGMDKIGHQEIVLEAVTHLRNFHYDLDRENLQHLALKLSTAATSLHRELSYCQDRSKLETSILSNVTNTISTIKPLACWLDRSPFNGQLEFGEKRAKLLKLAIDMATNGQRDRFADQPVAEISRMANELAKLADEIIQDISDPMLLQPASLDLATLKKRENDLGFSILPNYHGSLQISDIKFGSPAHTSGKIEDGDEIVQVNYQTVVGWQRQKVLLLFQESPPDVLLTLKKRPKHTKIYGQIYMKPYRLPSKKRALPFTRWHDNLPSPRPELLAIPDFDMPLSRRSKPAPEPVMDSSDSSDTDSDILTNQSPTVQNIMSDTTRLYLPKPRSVLQRRNTISGSSPFCNRTNFDISQFGRELKQSANHTGSSFDTHQLENDMTLSDPLSLRDKSASCGYGLEISPRPKTCLGVALKPNRNDPKDKEDKQASVNKSFKTEIVCYISDEGNLLEDDASANKSSKTVRFDTQSTDSVHIDGKVLTTNDPIPYADEENTENSNKVIDNASKILEGEKITVGEKEGTHMKFVYPLLNKLDDSSQIVNTVQNATIKSLSSTCRNPSTDLKPVVEPRTVFLYAPEPPPRPLHTLKPVAPGQRSNVREDIGMDQENLKQSPDLKSPGFPFCSTPLPKAPNLKPATPIRANVRDDVGVDLANLKQNTDLKSPSATSSAPAQKVPNEQPIDAEVSKTKKSQVKDHSEVPKFMESPKVSSGAPSMMSLLSKSRNLRKKNSLVNKRRCVSAKALQVTIPPPIKQGWLYQRVRSKNHQLPKWEKRLFILLDSTLYGFRSLEASKACCMLLLPGYTVSLATEVKSRELAFRVYHTGTVFYFSAENQEELSQWLQHLSRATLSHELLCETRDSKLYSESDTSDDEKDNSKLPSEHNNEQVVMKSDKKSSKTSSSASEKTVKSEKSHNLKFGSLKKFTRHKTEDNSPSSTSLDRKYLRFFSKNSEKSKALEKNMSKINSDMPIPTAQYRSYRKIPQNISIPVTDGNCNEKPEVDENLDDIQYDEASGSRKEKRKIPAPINYTHASNPNLVDFNASDFANKTHQFKSPSEKQPSRSDNLIGFVTLEQFMLNKQKEETAQVYSNRVLCGIEGARLKDIEENKMYKDKSNRMKSDDLQKQLQKIVPDVIYGQLNQKDTQSLPRKLHNMQNRILPKTPEVSPVPKKETFKSLPRKLFQNNFVDGYEIIHMENEDSNKYNQSSQSSEKHLTTFFDSQITKNDTWVKNEFVQGKEKKINSSSNEQQRISKNFECMDGTYQKKYTEECFESNSLIKNDEIYIPYAMDKYNKPVIQLKPAAQYTPMNLPLSSKISNQTVDINLDKSEPPATSNFIRLKNIFQTSLDNSCNHQQNYSDRNCENKNIIGISISSQNNRQPSK